jgi:hypothetical protein
MSRAAPLVLLALLAACGAGPEAELEQARSHLAGGAYAEAAAAASRGLATGAEGSTAWRLELAALEGEARGGNAADALARLARLAEGAWSAQVTGPLYVQTAGQLKEAGEDAGAIRVLDAGAKRFPQDADIAQALARSKATGTAAELEQLRSLGYVE